MKTRYPYSLLLVIFAGVIVSALALASPVHAANSCSAADGITITPHIGTITLPQNSTVSVTFNCSIANFNNEFGLWSPKKITLGLGHNTPAGTTFTLGSFSAGSELIFYLKNPQGNVFLSGPAFRNPDNVVHTDVVNLQNNTWQLGFEDQFGGKDPDYNDAIITVQVTPTIQCTTPPQLTCINNNVYLVNSCTHQQTLTQTCGQNQTCLNGACVTQPSACGTNAQCGTNGFTGSSFCQGNSVYQNYTTYTCNNPGTPNASCTSTTSAQKKNDCSANQTCSQGTCTSQNSCQVGPNLIPNGTLQPSSTPSIPSGWTSIAWGNASGAVFTFPAATNPPIDVGNAAQIQITNYGSASTGGSAEWYFTPVPVSGSKNLKFSDEYLSSTSTTIFAQYTVPQNSTDCGTPSHEGNNYYCYFALTSLPASNGSWKTASATLSVPLDATAVSVIHALSSNGMLAVGNFQLSEDTCSQFSQGMITFSFDDGWKSQYANALPLLSQANVPASFYIISNAMLQASDNDQEGTEDTYMTTDQVKSLQNSGNEIGVHTMDHCDLVMLEKNPNSATLPDGPPNGACASALSASSTPQAQVNGGRQALLNAGLSPADTFAYPYGSFDDIIKSLVKSSGISGARSVLPGFNTKSTDPYALNTQIIDLNATNQGVAPIEQLIDTALANKQWLIFTLHNIEPLNILQANGDVEGTTPEFLSTIINYVKSKQAKVVTVHQGLQSQ